MISVSHAFILGLVEGITEFLPISSTAHLVLTNFVLGNTLAADAIQTLEIAIQGGAILAVVIFFYSEFFTTATLRNVMLGSVPALIIAYICKDWAAELLSNMNIIAWALIVGGVILVGIEKYIERRGGPTSIELTPATSFWMGLSQCLALIPGISRSGASIVTGLVLRAPRDSVVTYSFFLAVPIISAATIYSIAKHPETLTNPDLLLPFIVAFTTACVAALCVIKYLLLFVRKFSFVPFGIYRIIIGCALLLM